MNVAREARWSRGLADCSCPLQCFFPWPHTHYLPWSPWSPRQCCRNVARCLAWSTVNNSLVVSVFLPVLQTNKTHWHTLCLTLQRKNPENTCKFIDASLETISTCSWILCFTRSCKRGPAWWFNQDQEDKGAHYCPPMQKYEGRTELVLLYSFWMTWVSL